MADQSSGTKTEKATPKKLRDARNKGDVAKSRDVTNTVLLVLGFLLIWQLGPTIGARFTNFTELVLSPSVVGLHEELASIGTEAVKLLFGVCAMLVLPMAVVGLLSEFFQAGPVFAMDKVAPRLSNLNPVAGVKKMFSTDSFVELLKSISKILLVVAIAVFTAISILPDAMKLPASAPASMILLLQSQSLMLFGWAMGIFAAIAVLDMSYQNYSHAKKMRMSFQDIKREHKSSEGDPLIKQQRQQLAREWSQQGAVRSAREAKVLIVNPTHVAIALQYDKDESPIPMVSARGVHDAAMAMREAAQDAGVPVLRNIRLARQLLANTSNGDTVPRELFGIVAEVILWANAAENRLRGEIGTDASHSRPNTPGEDLSRYTAVHKSSDKGIEP